VTLPKPQQVVSSFPGTPKVELFFSEVILTVLFSVKNNRKRGKRNDCKGTKLSSLRMFGVILFRKKFGGHLNLVDYRSIFPDTPEKKLQKKGSPMIYLPTFG